jgi:NitT/TauT family transport system substrate-binding protein
MLVPMLVGIAACGGDDDDTATKGTEAGQSGTNGGGGGTGEKITLGYSAWPSWFAWDVTEKAGIFDDLGLNVDLKYFSDYTASLDAMTAGKLDANSQTLNDTLLGVSTGSDQRIVVVQDNSAGNDAIIADKSIKTVEDLKGKTVAAEAGVVDHFLLLQGLADHDMTEKDIDFRGAPTDAAASGFSSGQFDAVGVFAPFTLEALKRPGSHVLFDSSDYPGTIPDHLVVSGDMVEKRPKDVQLLVDAWYKTLQYMHDHPDKARQIEAERAELSPAEYKSFEDGTKIFTAQEAMDAFDGKTAPTGLKPEAEKINDFLVDTKLIEEPAPLDKMFDSSFTADWIDRNGA